MILFDGSTMINIPHIYELIDQVPDNLIIEELYNTESGCFCVAGWMLHTAGASKEQVEDMEENEDWIDIIGIIYGLTYWQVDKLVSSNDRAKDDNRKHVVQQVLKEIVGV